MENQIPVSLSVNDRGKIKFAVRSEELDHWTYALRVALLGTLEKEPAILSGKRQIRARKKRLKRLEGNPLVRLFAREPDVEIADIRSELAMLEAQVRDAENELATFRGEVDRLMRTYNPEGLSYEEIQEKFTTAAIANKLANNAAVGMWSSQHGLPESVGRMFFHARALEPGERETFLDSIRRKCLEVDATNQASTLRALEEMAPDERAKFERMLNGGRQDG